SRPLNNGGYSTGLVGINKKAANHRFPANGKSFLRDGGSDGKRAQWLPQAVRPEHGFAHLRSLPAAAKRPIAGNAAQAGRLPSSMSPGLATASARLVRSSTSRVAMVTLAKTCRISQVA